MQTKHHPVFSVKQTYHKVADTSIKPFVPADIAEKHGLKLVEPFC